jgi:methylamine dehydrogenase accessory protein MauD
MREEFVWMAVLAARLALAVVFLVAGGAKLADLPGSRQALTEFGVPKPLAHGLGMGLPIAELAVGLSLLLVGSMWWGALAALLLLLLFIAGISINLSFGRRPPCHCFGQLHSEPAGPFTLARNIVLAAAAAFLVWQAEQAPAVDLLGWIGRLTGTQTLLAVGGLMLFVTLATILALLWQIVMQQGRVLLRFDALEARLTGGQSPVAAAAAPTAVRGLPVGTRAPDFRLRDLSGKAVTLADVLAAGQSTLLVFTNPHCGPCQALLPDIRTWQNELTGRLGVVLVSEGSAEDNRAKAAAQGVDTILLQRNREVAESYQAWGTPAAVLIRPDGSIGSALVSGIDAIRSLVAQLPASTAPADRVIPVPRVPLAIGGSVPAIELRDIAGRKTSLADFHGRRSLLIFWNPACGFCQQMLPDLRARDAAPGPDTPELIVASGGTAEEIRAMDLKSMVLFDPAFALGAAFGAHGTPMAVLINADGRVASKLAAGAEAIFKLLDHDREETPAIAAE